MLRKRLARLSYFIGLILVVAIFLFPILWIFLTSLKANTEIFRTPITYLPHKFTLENYLSMFKQLPYYIFFFRNSVIITSFTVILVLILSSLGGYAFGRLEFRGKNLFFSFIMAILAVPYLVYLIPVYMMESELNILDTHIGLILPYVALNLPFGIFIMRGIFRTIPSELEDVAKIDGCNSFQVFSKVMMPLSMQGVATVGVLTFIAAWGEFMFALTLMESSIMKTLPIGIVLLRDEGQSWAYGLLSAAVVVSIIPVILFFIALQRYFVRGIIEGSLKG